MSVYEASEQTLQGAIGLYAVGLRRLPVALCQKHAAGGKWRQETLEVWPTPQCGCGRCLAEEVREATVRCLHRFEALLTRPLWGGERLARGELSIFLRQAVLPWELPDWAERYRDRCRTPLVDAGGSASYVLICERDAAATTPGALDPIAEAMAGRPVPKRRPVLDGASSLIAITLVTESDPDWAEALR